MRGKLFLCLVLGLCVALPGIAQDKTGVTDVPNGRAPGQLLPLPGQGCMASGGTNCNAPIPAVGTSGPMDPSTMDVTDCDVIDDVNVGVALEHTFLGDLEITVTEPGGGTSVLVLDNSCGSDDDMEVVFDDEGAAFDCAQRLSGNNFMPLNPLTAFDGGSGTGTWTLDINDTFGGDSGQLLDWSLDLTCATVMPTLPVSWQAILAAILVLAGLVLLSRRRVSG